MISVDLIKSYVPKNKINLLKKYKKKTTKKFLINKIGGIYVARKRTKENNISMCINAFKKIQKKINPKVVILCTQNPSHEGLPHDSAIIHDKLKFNKKIACFDISQGCAGYIYSIKAAENFLKIGEQGVIFTCDTYSKIIKKNDFKVDILFGDAATVTVVKKVNIKEKKLKLITSSFYTEGSSHRSISKSNNKLNLDGKNVMKFCSTTVPKFIKEFLNKNKISIKEIDKFYFHQGSKYIIDILSKKLNLDKKQKPYCIEDLGNTVSSSLPISMEKQNFKKNNKIIVCGFGVGLSISIGYFKK